MQKICYELIINLAENYKEYLVKLLHELGIDDFVYGQIDCDLDAYFDIAQPQLDLYERLIMHSPLIIYSEDRAYLEKIKNLIYNSCINSDIQCSEEQILLQEIQNQNWRDSWKESFVPVIIQDKLAILPPWEDPNNFTQNLKIVINPGMAFGTGQHITTQLCLEFMLYYPLLKAKVLDLGTGSGILAIAAKLLGAQEVIATDIDADCQAIAIDNANYNKIADIQFYCLAIDAMPPTSFDFIIANIQAKPLIALMPAILERINKNGYIILSGILSEELEEFIGFLQKNKLRIIQTKTMHDWCALVCVLE